MSDLIFISQSRMVRFEEYDHLPLERLDLFRNLVQLRSVRLHSGFRSHLDLMNLALAGKTFHEATISERRRLLDIWHLPGLNGVLVASQALQEGFQPQVVNYLDAEWDRLEQLYLESDPPPLVAISTTFHLNWSEIHRITAKLRSIDDRMRIVVGGPFANAQTINGSPADFEKPMRKYGIRYVLHGFNSESDLIALLQAERSGSSLDSVPNLACIGDDGQFRTTQSVWHDPNLGPAAALWDRLHLPFIRSTVQIRTASGCPFSCSFCSYPATAGGHFAGSVEAMKAELDRIKKLRGVSQVIFIDDTFNVPIRRFVDILRTFHAYNMRWYSFLRCQYVDETQVHLMRDSGCAGVYLGIESANDQLLANMNKRARPADFERGIDLLRKYQIPTFAAFVVGFPGETEKTIRQNIDFVERNNVDFYSLKEFYYMPHTAVHADRKKYGLSGKGHEWAHKTMSSTEASLAKLHMFSEIKNSVYVDADTSLWYIAYLREVGLSLEQIKAAQRIINRMMALDNEGRFGDKDELLAALTETLRYGTGGFRCAKLGSSTATGSPGARGYYVAVPMTRNEALVSRRMAEIWA